MRCMERNKQTFYYALYEGKEAIVDEYGNTTGEYKVIWGNPQKYSANVSAAKGDVSSNQFGENLSYDKTIIADDITLAIDEYSILWIDTKPELNEDGSLKKDDKDNVITPHDYIVKKVAKSINSVTYAISKVDVQ